PAHFARMTDTFRAAAHRRQPRDPPLVLLELPRTARAHAPHVQPRAPRVRPRNAQLPLPEWPRTVRFGPLRVPSASDPRVVVAAPAPTRELALMRGATGYASSPFCDSRRLCDSRRFLRRSDVRCSRRFPSAAVAVHAAQPVQISPASPRRLVAVLADPAGRLPAAHAARRVQAWAEGWAPAPLFAPPEQQCLPLAEQQCLPPGAAAGSRVQAGSSRPMQQSALDVRRQTRWRPPVCAAIWPACPWWFVHASRGRAAAHFPSRGRT